MNRSQKSRSKRRPPIPSEVTVAWFWDGDRWSIDWTAVDKKECVATVQDGIFPHRHRYVTYGQVHRTKEPT